jgi:hypothetical protein
MHEAMTVQQNSLDPRTVQPVASRYTDWATGHNQHVGIWNVKITDGI